MSMPPPPPPPPSSGWGSTPPPGYQPYATTSQSATPPYAGFGARLGGYLLDGLLYGLLMAVFVVPAVILGIAAFDGCNTFERADGTTDVICPPGKPEGGMLAGAITLAVIGLIIVAVLYVRALGRTGQTWGRKIAGVKVVKRETGLPLGTGKAFLRWLVAGIVSGNCVLGYLWMLWDKDKQTWHDKIIGSIVIKV